MGSLNITFVASTMRMGGAERSTYELGRRLADDGDRVDLVCLREAGAVGEMFRRSSLPVVENTAPARRDLRAYFRLRRHFLRRGTQVAYFLDHTNAVFSGVAAAVTARVPARVMVMHTTGLSGGGSSLPVGVRAALPGLSRVIATASAQERYLRSLGVPVRKLVTIRNGVETSVSVSESERRVIREELGIAPDDLAVGMIAMFRPEKAHEILFEAVQRLRPSYPRLRVLLVGDGPRREELVMTVDRMGLAGVVRFLGMRPDAPRLAAAFDVIVLTSLPLVETLPFSLLEAMARGVPAVATRVGSLSEAVEDGGGGVLVPPGDAVAFAGALSHVLGDPGVRRRLGRNGREWVAREFGIERVVRETRELFCHLVPGGGDWC